DDDGKPRGPRHLDRQVRSLLGAHSAQEQQEVLLVGPEAIAINSDAVQHGGRPGEVWSEEPLRLRDGDELHRGPERAIEVAHLTRHRPMHRYDRRSLATRAVKSSPERMVVNQVWPEGIE